MTASEKLAELEEAVRDLLAALGPCGDFDKHGNCRKHFATCPCPVGEADVLLSKMRESAPSPERSGSQDGSDAFTPLRRTAGNLRLCSAVLPDFQKSTADTMRGFAEEIELWIESMANTQGQPRREENKHE